MVRTSIVWTLLLASCSYEASFRDCEIQCTDATGCPDGFRCDAEGLCRLNGETQSCTAVLGDAGLGDADTTDAPPDAFACITHSECLAMAPNTCCVDPGPTGYCTPGIVIAGSCNPQ